MRRPPDPWPLISDPFLCEPVLSFARMNAMKPFLPAILSIAAIASASLPSGAKVATQVLDQPFYVAGLLTRTSNAAEASGESKIGPLWQRFMHENLAAQIPNRADTAFTVVYSNYASDETGAYDYLLGARVTSTDHLPAGMSWRKVEPGTYAIILTDKGQMPSVLQAAWDHIWHMSPGDLGGKRAFISDYEIYDQRTTNPQNAQVEIHIGLKPTSK
jgi:predicted transcriptional regulator YdeE